MPNPRNIAQDSPSATTEFARVLVQRLSAESMVRVNEPLAQRTTLRVGGPAALYVQPASEADLKATIEFCREHHLPFFVLGRGSNLLVRDGGFRGAVICLAQAGFCGIEVSGRQIRCGAGARLKAVAAEARRHGLAGFEFLDGIPGSVGGALRMNAGAMGDAIFNRVESVRLMDFEGRMQELKAAEMEPRYRTCGLLKDHIALAAVLTGQPADPQAIERRMGEFNRRRWQSQPAAASAGCMFKNPPTVPAGRLIDELGLKGARVGGAMISMEHGNFLVNDGGATAADVLNLIEVVRTRARAERGIELELEVEVVGDG